MRLRRHGSPLQSSANLRVLQLQNNNKRLTLEKCLQFLQLQKRTLSQKGAHLQLQVCVLRLLLLMILCSSSCRIVVTTTCYSPVNYRQLSSTKACAIRCRTNNHGIKPVIVQLNGTNQASVFFLLCFCDCYSLNFSFIACSRDYQKQGYLCQHS